MCHPDGNIIEVGRYTQLAIDRSTVTVDSPAIS
jgi:hypothetical protein